MATPYSRQNARIELTRYLPDVWVPIIEKDVDGPNSLPLRVDAEVPNLGKLSATRRVARTIYLGSAPTAAAAHRGIEDRQVKLGCVMPGESPAVFGDALRRLASAATYLYQDGPRAWYATQPTVTKLAEDRAEQLKRDPDKIAAELDARLRTDLRRTGDFARIHPLPRSSADVPDDTDARLVVLPAEHSHSKEAGNAAEAAAKAILESRGTAPRLFRNTLVFLAADRVRLQDLDEALRKYLAWSSIVAEKDPLNLDPHQARQAETQKQAADGAVTARLFDDAPGRVQRLQIETVAFHETEIVSEDRTLYFDIGKVDGIPKPLDPGPAWVDGRFQFAAPHQIGWLHFEQAINNSADANHLDTTLRYAAVGAKATLYVYSPDRNTKNGMSATERRDHELRTVGSTIQSMSPTAIAPWPIHVDEPFAMQYFLIGENMSIAAVADMGDYILKLRLTYFDDLKMRELMQFTIKELTSIAQAYM